MTIRRIRDVAQYGTSIYVAVCREVFASFFLREHYQNRQEPMETKHIHLGEDWEQITDDGLHSSVHPKRHVSRQRQKRRQQLQRLCAHSRRLCALLRHCCPAPDIPTQLTPRLEFTFRIASAAATSLCASASLSCAALKLRSCIHTAHVAYFFSPAVPDNSSALQSQALCLASVSKACARLNAYASAIVHDRSLGFSCRKAAADSAALALAPKLFEILICTNALHKPAASGCIRHLLFRMVK